MDSEEGMSGQADRPVYRARSPVDDEIDLIDLWIALFAHKKRFFVLASILILVGLAVVYLFYEDKIALRSIIEIETVYGEEGPVPVEAPGSIVKVIELVLLPDLSEAYGASPDYKWIADARISNPENSNLIVVESRMPLPQQEIVAEFHGQLITAIMKKLNRRSLSARNWLKTEIATNLRTIESLRQEADILGGIPGQQAAEKQDKSVKAAQFSGSREGAMKPGITIIEQKIERLQTRISELDQQSNNLGSRVLKQASLTDKSTGMTRSGWNVLAVFLAVSIAFIVVLGRIFTQKIKQRKTVEG